MKTTKLYIDKELRLRASENEWPEPKDYAGNGYYFALAKAKEESLVIGNFPDGLLLLNMAARDLAPDSFIDLPVEVEFYSECTRGSCVHGDAGCYADGMPGEVCSAKRIARLKPQTKEVTASALPDVNDKDEARNPAQAPH